MGRVADTTSGRTTTPDTVSTNESSTTGTLSAHDRLMALRPNTPYKSDDLTNPEAPHNKAAADMQQQRKLNWEGSPVSRNPRNPAINIEANRAASDAMQDYLGVNPLSPREWLRGIDRFFSYGKNWLEATEYNLADLVQPNAMQTPEAQAMLAKRVLTGQLTPIQAAREGLRIDSGNWDIEDMYNKFRGLLRMKPDGITAAEVMVNGEHVKVPKLSVNPSAGDLYVDITEEDWWRRITGDKAYQLLDSFAINFSQPTPASSMPMALQSALIAVGNRADLSVMDALRLTTFMLRDPLFLVPVDQIYRGGKVMLGFKGTPEVRALTGGKPLIINRALIHDAETIERYNAEKSAAIQEFIESNPKATPEAIDVFKRSLPDLVAWQDAVRRNKLIKNYSLVMPDTPEVANRRAAYENAVYSKASDKEIMRLRDSYLQALDSSRTVITTGAPGRSFEESVKIAVTHLRDYNATQVDVNSMITDPKISKQFTDIINNPNLSSSEMSEALLKFARTPEQIDQVSAAIKHLEVASDRMIRVKVRLRNAGLSDAQVEERVQELMADAVVGLQYRSKYGIRKPGLTGAESADDWLNPLIMSDDDLAHRDLLADPEVEDIMRLVKKGEVPELSPIKLSPMSYFWGDPYFKTNFAPLAMAHREAQLAMVDYLTTWQTRLNKIISRIGIRGRDRLTFGISGESRARLRELYGKALAIEQTIPKRDLHQYYLIDGNPVTPEFIENLRSSRIAPLQEHLDEVEKVLTKQEADIRRLQQRRTKLLSDYERVKLDADIEASRTGEPQIINAEHPDKDPDYVRLLRLMDANASTIETKRSYQFDIDSITDDVLLKDAMANPLAEATLAREAEVTQITRRLQQLRQAKARAKTTKEFNDFTAEITRVENDLGSLKDTPIEGVNTPHKVEVNYQRIIEEHAEEFAELTTEDWDNIAEIRKLTEQLYSDLLVQRPELAERLTGDSVTSRNLMSLVNLLMSRNKREITNFSSEIARDNAYFLGTTERKAGEPVWDIIQPLQYVINEANRQIHLSPVLREMDLEIKAANAAGDIYRANYLKIILARMRGEPTPLDKTVDGAYYSIINSLPISNSARVTWLQSMRPPTQVATGIVHGMYRGLLTGNAGFMIKNLFQSANTVGLAGRIPTLKGAYSYFCTPDGKALAEHAHLTYEFENFMAMNSVRSNVGKALDDATLATEQVNRGIAFWVGVNEGLDILVRQGMIKKASVEEAVAKGYGRYVFRQGTDVAFQTQHIYGSYGTPAGWIGRDIFGGDIARTGVQFVNYQLKQADFAKRMFADGNVEGLIRWFQTSGHIVRMLSDAGINGTEFVGPYMGNPDVTGPAPTLGWELMLTGGAMFSGNDAEQDRHWNNVKKLATVLAGGYVGIPVTPIKRGIEYYKSQAGPDETDGIIRNAKGDFTQQLDDRDAIYKLIGLPSTTMAERQASTELLYDLNMQHFWASTQKANMLAETYRPSIEEGRDLDEVEQEIIRGITADMVEDPMSTATANQVLSAVKRHQIPQGIRQLMSTANLRLLRDSGKIDKIRSILEVNRIWLQSSWGEDNYNKAYKAISGIEYEEASLRSADKIIQKGSNNDTQQ